VGADGVAVLDGGGEARADHGTARAGVFGAPMERVGCYAHLVWVGWIGYG
jgi:hypothetical protein